MESIIVVVPSNVSLELALEGVPSTWKVEPSGQDRFVVSSDGRRAYISVDPSLMDELESDEQDSVLKLVPSPTFFVVDYSDIGFCRELLSAIADRPDVVVDNDHGVLCPGSTFVSMLRERPLWDWRTTS